MVLSVRLVTVPTLQFLQRLLTESRYYVFGIHTAIVWHVLGSDGVLNYPVGQFSQRLVDVINLWLDKQIVLITHTVSSAGSLT